MPGFKKIGRCFSFAMKKSASSGDGAEVYAHVLPPLVRNALEYLTMHDCSSVEGIFRVTGSIADIEKISKKYEKGTEVLLDTITNPHTVAGLLKHYLRHKSGGIVPAGWMRSCFLAAGDIEDEAVRILCVTTAIKLLPPSNMYLLLKICEYLFEVQSKQSINKMGVYNLAVIFGNTFIPSSTDNIDIALTQNSHAYAFTETLITHYEEIFFSKECRSVLQADDMPTKAKAFLDLVEQNSSPRQTASLPASPIPNRIDNNININNIINNNANPKQKQKTRVANLLGEQHKCHSHGGFEAEKVVAPPNKYLDEVLAKNMCDRGDVELLAEYIRIGETELFQSYLLRIATSSSHKEKITKAAQKLFKNTYRM